MLSRNGHWLKSCASLVLVSVAGIVVPGLRAGAAKPNAEPSLATTPAPLRQGADVFIGAQRYLLRLLDGATFSGNNHYVQTGQADLAYLRMDGVARAVNPLQPGWARSIKAKWPLLCVSPDGAFGLALDQDRPCLVDLQSQQILERFEILKECSRWVFSPGGQFIYPLSGYAAGGYPYIDVRRKSVLLKPVLGDPQLTCHFTGASSPGGKSIRVFTRNQDNPGSGSSPVPGKVLAINPDQPETMAVNEDRVGVVRAFDIKDQNILCEIGENRTALLSSVTMQMTAAAPTRTSGRIHWMGFAPKGTDIYVLDSFSGLHILSGTTLQELAHLATGRSANAASIGVTFSADGRLAFVATPYSGTVSVIDTQKRQVIQEISLGENWPSHDISAAGVLLFPTQPGTASSPNRGICLVITCVLPYE